MGYFFAMKSKAHLLLLTFLIASLSAQPVFSQTLLSTLNRYNEAYEHEKMHVQFDKPVYSAGETVWFKAYLVSKNVPTTVSTNLHAELLDAAGLVIEKKVYPIYEASAAGSFDLPKGAKGEGLLFRAYTTWMLNFDTAFLYTKALTASKAAAVAKKETTMRFFPEGGDWVAALPSVVAFKATDETGRPRRVSGVIKDNKGTAVADFKTVHDGMGKVSLVPETGATYVAEWKDESGQTGTTPLPEVKADGLTLEVKHIGNTLNYIISRREEADARFQRVHIVANMHQYTVYRATANLTKSSIISGGIPLDSLVSGTLTLTLFDERWKPLAERVAFVDRDDYRFSATVSWTTKNLGKRGKNVLEVEVPDSLRANLSLAITDAQVSEGGQEEIVSRLLLTSDLRGYVHNPAYYFSSSADSVKEHRDLLLLTHGWRRYNWEALAAGLLPRVRFPRENYLAIRGNIYGILPGQLRPDEQINLIFEAKDSSRQFVAVPIQRDGSFALQGAIFYDTVKLYYMLNDINKTNRKASVEFARQAYPASIKLGIDTTLLVQQRTVSLSSREQFFVQKREEVLPELNRKIRTLENVTVRAKTRSREQELEKRYTTGMFQGGNSRNFNLLDDPIAGSYTSAFQYLQGKVPGLQISGAGGSYTLNRRGSAPALFMDEIPIDADYLANLPVTDIAYIKVFDPPFMGAVGGGAGGAIAIYTRRGGETPRTNIPGLARGSLVGYAPLKDFYSPDYATSSPLHEVEDVRSTLYWNPFLLTGKASRKVQIQFYNNDVSTSLRVVLEGMNEEGRLTRVEQVIR
jgi:hypothetical protein